MAETRLDHILNARLKLLSQYADALVNDGSRAIGQKKTEQAFPALQLAVLIEIAEQLNTLNELIRSFKSGPGFPG